MKRKVGKNLSAEGLLREMRPGLEKIENPRGVLREHKLVNMLMSVLAKKQLIILTTSYVLASTWLHAEVTLDGTLSKSGALMGPHYQIGADLGQ